MKSILLVNPDTSDDTTNYGALAELRFLEKKAFMAPLPLATIAALTPDGYHVDIWDETVHGRIDDVDRFRGYDLIGLTGYEVHIHRAKELALAFRRAGFMVVVGGPGASSAPERYADYFDIVFVGEAEYTWPQFLSDWAAGKHRAEYRQIIKPELDISPAPMWSGLAQDLRFYFTGAVQTTRGCPFDCEFCDVIFIYGRQPRHKPIPRVIAEVSELMRLGVTSIFFCDDNFIGNPHYAKELLEALMIFNQSGIRPVSFSTQITLNVAKNERLLYLLAKANFSTLYIGVESPNKESLREANKPQNFRTDLLEDLHRILSYGLPVRGAMIVGFDHDDLDIFEQQYQFIQQSCMPIVSLNMLKAPVGTKLWLRLLGQRRVLRSDPALSDNLSDMSYGQTNIIPKRMTRLELMRGYIWLYKRVTDWSSFAERVKGFIALAMGAPTPNRGDVAPAGDPMFVRQMLHSISNSTAKEAVLDILAYANSKAPFLIDKVIGVILQNIGMTGMVARLETEVGRQIDQETRLGLVSAFIETTPVYITVEFQNFYQKIFPHVYQKLSESLADNAALPEALVEVFRDFLLRCGPHFQNGDPGMDDFHRVAIDEICDRTIAARNQNGYNPPSMQRIDARNDRTARQLKSEVLKFVERELRTSIA